jgi:hypothetical protein
MTTIKIWIIRFCPFNFFRENRAWAFRGKIGE